ncbi:hypothetical protein MUO71_04440 [Candidatus Bathyarchaeota archaeon]|nr:hypothetical protein [Candidatus Bathyarchaeota archaeon]
MRAAAKNYDVTTLTPTSRLSAQKLVILLRNTTWKCGKVERLIVSYLQLQLQRCGTTQSSMKDLLEHFRLSGKQRNHLIEAIKRLERRGILKTVSTPFSMPSEFNMLSRQGGL